MSEMLRSSAQVSGELPPVSNSEALLTSQGAPAVEQGLGGAEDHGLREAVDRYVGPVDEMKPSDPSADAALVEQVAAAGNNLQNHESVGIAPAPVEHEE